MCKHVFPQAFGSLSKCISGFLKHRIPTFVISKLLSYVVYDVLFSSSFIMLAEDISHRSLKDSEVHD